ncbi:Septin-interacting protein 1 [Eumeta japonica]|uniref:Septin-interacting protein 1 n=1 Tax=Eumeta variegata TaxID=151549 RepID=A0A4C2AEG1_EUMVA|nr:Septin-interacting protein 1 [Eumeta japonica]
MLTPWKGAFDDSEMQVFLLQHIIPKLQMVLTEFIINPLQQDLDYSEISRWYSAWKSMLSEEVLREPSVKEHLRRALELCIVQPIKRLQQYQWVVLSTQHQYRHHHGPTTTSHALRPEVSDTVQLDFKELVSRKCSDSVLFVPHLGAVNWANKFIMWASFTVT